MNKISCCRIAGVSGIKRVAKTGGCGAVGLETGKFELWRRLLLLFFGAVGIWLFMYVSPAPLIRIEIVDFTREQERETSGPHVTDRHVHLAAIPLQEYIDIITEDNLIEPEGERWGNFVDQAGAAVEGQLPDE